MKLNLAVVLTTVLISVGTVDADELTQMSGKWELFGPMEVGNMGLVGSASVNEEGYVEGRKKDIVVECKFKELMFRIRDYTADLSMNDGQVKYQVDDQPEAVWEMETFKPKEQIVQFTNEKAVEALRTLYGGKTLRVQFALPDGSSMTHVYDIEGIEDKLNLVGILCSF